MKIYTRNAGKWEVRTLKRAADFNYMDSATFLATQPKWEASGFVGAKDYLERVEYGSDFVGEQSVYEGQMVEKFALIVSDSMRTETSVTQERSRPLGETYLK